MLDLTIEAVCDRFDLGNENEHECLLSFLRILIKHSGARLSPFSLQRMFRALHFLSIMYSTKSDWIINGLSMPCNNPSNENISPFKVIKQLTWDIVAHVEYVESIIIIILIILIIIFNIIHH